MSAISKDTIIELRLTAKEVNTILDGLSALPYKDVYHLIESIHSQVRKNSDIKKSSISKSKSSVLK
jgi:hypothetical protein